MEVGRRLRPSGLRADARGDRPLVERVSFSLIISALNIGSSLIVLSGKGPLFLDFPVFGILGFLLAGVLGFALAIAILRSGKL